MLTDRAFQFNPEFFQIQPVNRLPAPIAQKHGGPQSDAIEVTSRKRIIAGMKLRGARFRTPDLNVGTQ